MGHKWRDRKINKHGGKPDFPKETQRKKQSIYKTYRHQNSEALGNNITKGKTELEDKSRLNLKGINHESPTKTQITDQRPK